MFTASPMQAVALEASDAPSGLAEVADGGGGGGGGDAVGGVSTSVAQPSDVPAVVSEDIAGSDGDSSDQDDSDEDDLPNWASTPLYEEILNDDKPFDYSQADPEVCTAEEAQRYRSRLREVGIEEFVQETLGSRNISARKLCSAFKVRIPPFLAEENDEAFYQLLGIAMLKELQKRQRLAEYNTIDDAVQLLKSSNNIMVITGAGISTSLGIPDFRSKSTGFYSKLLGMGFQEPEQVFDLEHFDEDPRIFYSLAGDILPDLHKWTPTHQFIRLLQDKGKLMRNYTQNIDNVESHAGIKAEKLIQCHGSWATATCRKCKNKVSGETIFESIRNKEVARCKPCEIELQTTSSLKRKRSNNGSGKSKKRGGIGGGDDDDDDDSDGQYDIPEAGVMKPDIIFFGETLPDKFFDVLENEDRDAVDLIIVIGTSMKVQPVSDIPQFVSHKVPQIYISRDPIHHIDFDINLLGDCDAVVAELCRRAGWDLQHDMLIPNQKIKVHPHEAYECAYTVTVESE